MHRADNKHTKHRRRTPCAAERLEREAGYLCAFADASLAETHPWIFYGSGCILVVSGLAATIKKVSVHACSPCISSVISVKALPWKIITVNMALPNNNKLYYPNASHWARVPSPFWMPFSSNTAGTGQLSLSDAHPRFISYQLAGRIGPLAIRSHGWDNPF